MQSTRGVFSIRVFYGRLAVPRAVHGFDGAIAGCIGRKGVLNWAAK